MHQNTAQLVVSLLAGGERGGGRGLHRYNHLRPHNFQDSIPLVVDRVKQFPNPYR